MRALLLVAAALALGTGCFARPWDVEESDRIDRVVAFEVDESEAEAFEGIPAPRNVSPTLAVANAPADKRYEIAGLATRKRVSGLSSAKRPRGR